VARRKVRRRLSCTAARDSGKPAFLSATVVPRPARPGPDVSLATRRRAQCQLVRTVRGWRQQFADAQGDRGPRDLRQALLRAGTASHVRAAGVARGTDHYAHPELPPEPQEPVATVRARPERRAGSAAGCWTGRTRADCRRAAMIRLDASLPKCVGRRPQAGVTDRLQPIRGSVRPPCELDEFTGTAVDRRLPQGGNDKPEVPGGWPTGPFWQNHPPIPARVPRVFAGARGTLPAERPGRFARLANMNAPRRVAAIGVRGSAGTDPPVHSTETGNCRSRGVSALSTKLFGERIRRAGLDP